jgi:cytoskeletal protein CcmA (bactofilin family)
MEGTKMCPDATSPRRTDADTSPEPKPVDERRLAAWIGKSLRIEGNVVSSQDLTIEGQVEGTIEIGEQTLIIGTGATVKAHLTARIITISGAVTGNVTASEKLELRATGSVLGDLVTPRLLMADGAAITGKVDVDRKNAQRRPE